LAQLIRTADPVPREIPDRRPLTEVAIGTIVSQLLSTAASRTISERLYQAHGSAAGVIAWAEREPVDAPASHGLSRAKRRAIAAWGRLVAEGGDPRARWGDLPAEQLIAEIMALRGFGRWSAEMLAIFGFGHPDIWPEGDVAVMRVMRRLYPRRGLASIRARVAGHGSFVALCCWEVTDRGLEDQLAPRAGRRLLPARRRA
jgi:DNA-3-methyladenine glycosylase II